MFTRLSALSAARHGRMDSSAIRLHFGFVLRLFILSVIFSSCAFNSGNNFSNQPELPPQSVNRRLLQDMAHFDQLYIPALRYTSLEQQTESAKYLQLLLEYWAHFKVRYYDFNPQDPQWQADLDSIQYLITQAKRVVDSGKNLLSAHQDYLEKIRLVFMELRTRNHINDYFIDHLTRFHKPMETIVLAAKNKTPADFTAQDLSVIKNTLPEALETFQAIKEAPLDKSIFGFNEDKHKVIRKLIADEDQALINLQNALQTGNTQQIISAALNIKPGFAKLFMQFGNFNL